MLVWGISFSFFSDNQNTLLYFVVSVYLWSLANAYMTISNQMARIWICALKHALSVGLTRCLDQDVLCETDSQINDLYIIFYII